MSTAPLSQALHLNPLHFTTLQTKHTSHKSRLFIPHHYTSHHFTYLHSPLTWIPLLLTTFLTLFLKVLSLQAIYLLTAIGLPSSGSSTVHVYTQTEHRTTQSTQTIYRTTQLIWEECGPCPIFESYTLAFALQLRKKHRKTSVRVAKECQLAHWKQNIQKKNIYILHH